MTRTQTNLTLIVAGLAAVVAFFLPFLDLGGLITASGWDVLVGEGVPWTKRLLLLAVPVGGLALIAAGLSGHRNARVAGLLFGAGVYGYLGYQLVRAFFATTGIGLWITLAAAAVAFGAALVQRRSST